MNKTRFGSSRTLQEDLKLASDLIVEPYLAARLRRIKDYIIEHKAVLVFVNRREDA